MGQIVHAFIEHKLTPEEILQLPELLCHISNDILVGQWHWSTPNMNKQILIDLWTRKTEYFINNIWSEQDFALLEMHDMTFHFFSPRLLTFDNSIRWDVYNKNESVREEFNRLAKAISSLLNAVDILVVPDLSSVSFFEEDKDTTVDSYRQKAKCNKLYSIELV
ncbi:hypothetical protein QTN47_21460 [Danxiaibacter flavus]|uniref:Uncharacterized protein n=1 Tax=Danxiaibacter flavus TaxID=3049108 RepID=A0ABV3ZLZ2_9BACT|nr:hypothetical protein QNM32_21465 [Chitinophagaceae bacterium DXS]